MEEIKKHLHYSFIGGREGVGCSFISLNFAVELIARNYRVIYSTSNENEHADILLRNKIKVISSLSLNNSKIDRLRVLTFPKDFQPTTDEKLDTMLAALPYHLSEEKDIYIHNLNDPQFFPDRYILSNSDACIIALRVDAKSVSEYFSIINNMTLYGIKPAKIFVVFNYTSDMERAFDLYSKILKETGDFKIDMQPFFIGIIPNDFLRQAYAVKLKLPLRLLFPESSIKGSVAFMADKILSNNKESAAETMSIVPYAENE